MSSTYEIGRRAENIAAEFLQCKGYKLLHRNWRFYQKELDIIASYNKKLIIVEVKSCIGNISETPSDMITIGKMKNIVDAAEAYIFRYNIQEETRFDVIAVSFYGVEHFTQHIEGAFVPGINW